VIANDLLTHPELNPDLPTAYRWKHQVAGDDEGWQAINYSQYYMTVVVEMHLEKFLGFANTTEINRYVSTYRDVVFGPYGPGYTTMREYVYGTTTTGSDLYGFSSFARWDASGKVLAIAQQLYDDDTWIQSASGALMAVSQRGAAAADAPEIEAPEGGFRLSNPSPEPFVRESLLSYRLPQAAFVRITVHDSSGRKIRTIQEGSLGPGEQRAVWDGRTDAGDDAPAGAYYVRFEAGSVRESRRMTLIR
jgi:hypothetical protein